MAQIIRYWYTLHNNRVAGLKPGFVNASHYSEEVSVQRTELLGLGFCVLLANPKFLSLHDLAYRLACRRTGSPDHTGSQALVPSDITYPGW